MFSFHIGNTLFGRYIFYYVCKKKSCMRGQLFLIHSHVFHGADHEAGGTAGGTLQFGSRAANIQGIYCAFRFVGS